MVICTCYQCGKEFSAKQRTVREGKPRRFCSHDCYGKSLLVEKVRFVCKTCNKVMDVNPSKLRGGYCSYECSRLGKFQDLHTRFWNKVEKRGIDECWPWIASTDRRGYGLFPIDGRHSTSSRAAYRFTFGPIEPGKTINHHCDNPPCCNPKHLYAGTMKQNTRDMMIRGRQKTKFTDDDVIFIRCSGLGTRFLAYMFDTSESHMSSIKNGHIWKHVEF